MVLSAILAVAAAKPSYGHYAEVPAVSYGVAAAGPFAYAAAAPLVAAAPAVAYAPVAAGAAITKTVHYANTPVVTGYTASVVKPHLGSVATPPFTVTNQHVIAPARSVQTVVPHVTQVEPEITVQKVAVDVPVHTPVVSEVEVRTPVVQAAPAVAAVSYAAAPVAYAGPAVAAAPLAYATPAVAAAAPVVPAAPVVAAVPAGVVSSYSTKQSSSSSHSSHSSEVEVKTHHNVW